MSSARAYAAALACLLALAGCGDHGGSGPDAGGADAAADGGTPLPDGAADASPVDSSADAWPGAADAAATDGSAPDGPAPDAAPPPDATPPPPDAAPDAAPPPDATPDAMTGVVTGGPCMSGTAGATAYRIRWAGSGGTAYPVYEVNGLPDTSRDHAGAYGYQIGFSPSFVDTFLAQGGLLLNSSSFVDLEISTAGLAQIDTATLSIYGRSYNTTASGSFNWQTWDGTGAAPVNLVHNSAPYEWYSADMTTEISPGDSGVLIRIKAGPSSGSLAVNRIELCMQAL